jgi:hypothetical protein
MNTLSLLTRSTGARSEGLYRIACGPRSVTCAWSLLSRHLAMVRLRTATPVLDGEGRFPAGFIGISRL